jgi:hypothetical protein
MQGEHPSVEMSSGLPGTIPYSWHYNRYEFASTRAFCAVSIKYYDTS